MEEFPAPHRSFDPVVLFVPFFGGTSVQLHRHIQMVNDIGFDAASVNLSIPSLADPRPPISRSGHIGVKHLWADRVEDALNRLGHQPRRPVILYAFSGPAASALAAIARTRQTEPKQSPSLLSKAGELLGGRSMAPSVATEIRGIVCDSGPFVDLWHCNWRYMYHEAGLKFLPLRGVATAASIVFWGHNATQTLHMDLRSIGRAVPILSIRGWNDKLISLKAMDDAFPRDANLDLQVLSIPQAGHLDSLKVAPEIYTPRVQSFLKQLAP